MNEEFKVKEYTFRVKKMNAIEILALKTQMKFNSLEQSQSTLKGILECIEVKAGESWVPVKMKGKEVYTPDCLEQDVDLLNDLINEFTIGFLSKVFQKSDELK